LEEGMVVSPSPFSPFSPFSSVSFSVKVKSERRLSEIGSGKTCDYQFNGEWKRKEFKRQNEKRTFFCPDDCLEILRLISWHHFHGVNHESHFTPNYVWKKKQFDEPIGER